MWRWKQGREGWCDAEPWAKEWGSWKRRGNKTLPKSPQTDTLLTPWIYSCKNHFGLLTSKTVRLNLCGFTPPDLWSFVTAAIGNSYSTTTDKDVVMKQGDENPCHVDVLSLIACLCQALACVLDTQYPLFTSVLGAVVTWGRVSQRPCSLKIWGSSGHARLDWVCCTITVLGGPGICSCHLWCQRSPGWTGLLWVPGKPSPSSCLTTPGVVRLFPKRGGVSFIQGHMSSILCMNCPHDLSQLRCGDYVAGTSKGFKNII